MGKAFLYCPLLLTPDRRQSKTHLTIDERESKKTLETVFSIAICRQSGDKWHSKTLFLTLWSTFLDTIDVFHCNISGVLLLLMICNPPRVEKSKWAWPGNATMIHHRPTHDTSRKKLNTSPKLHTRLPHNIHDPYIPLFYNVWLSIFNLSEKRTILLNL